MLVLVCVFGVQYAGVAFGILLTAWHVFFCFGLSCFPSGHDVDAARYYYLLLLRTFHFALSVAYAH